MTEKVQGIVLDWAGTTVDYGCMAPVRVFLEIFGTLGIEPTLEEVRAPMGRLKWDHIKEMLDMPRIGKLFEERMGRPYTDRDVDGMHAEFEPMLLSILPQFSEPIGAAAQVVEQLRGQGLKIGATTGYNDAMMAVVAAGAKAQGYAPDHWITPDSVGGRGRPYPYMIFANMIRLDMGMPRQVVKVGDTASDMQEARSAGAWAVGVVEGSSMLGLTLEEKNALKPEELRERAELARQQFIRSGAHHVIDRIEDLPELIEVINARLAQGESPHGD
ncbi:phosphonoacetaldehyde hydrolase [Saccharibacillus qingshengii]|uniref:phosphonoacetaldehyde hydrolase n=1 Tax=Saccharibacillus qingshengii TaxID=1763540 RepID=UPI001553A5CE|nr:phosphonoacetaldehyde hydrolase [Saccharibacillus qingshengii]